ncbi:MAG: hypothetical protein D6814_17045 [Calditrichaeota bacterium]|nr:MAG: hypothetical protein D6814_17045 [Calditrichota bacterium]
MKSAEQFSASEKRYQRDRRRQPTPPASRFWLWGRRKGPRRKQEAAQSYYVDRYSVSTLLMVLSILALSVLDAFLTLYLIDRGAAEINPVMAHFLEYGPVAFMAAKYLLTTAAIILLLIHKNVFIFRLPIRAKIIFLWMLGIFAGVVLWEIYLIHTL